MRGSCGGVFLNWEAFISMVIRILLYKALATERLFAVQQVYDFMSCGYPFSEPAFLAIWEKMINTWQEYIFLLYS